MEQTKQPQRKLMRLKHYDYSQAGGYFVTICAQNRQMILEPDEIQKVIQQYWDKLPEKYAEVEADQFIIMPNHIHGILFIVGAVHEPPKYNKAIHELPLQQRRQMVLPKIIGYFKMNTAKHINRIRNTPGFPLWQRNYYEHIIRNENELTRIREYIINNPLKWHFDRENPERVSNKQYEEGLKWLEGN
ncbi:MAG: transposase [Planctomycetes bacterium]|nr:transposase [Planctomycetota bacterium]